VLPWFVAAPLRCLAVASGMPRRHGASPTAVMIRPMPSAGTVVAVDIVESHPDLLVVDLTCNAADARHADAITRAVGEVEGARVHNVSDRNLSFLHSTARAA
jgi:hypothetical protein